MRHLLLVVAVMVCGALTKPPAKTSASLEVVSILPDPILLKALFRSQLEFVADLFWIRMSNVAGTANTATEYGALIPLGNLVADLSPRFKYPYYVGGVLAPVQRGRLREYDNAEGAIALMRRGVRAVPDYTRLFIQLAWAEIEMLHDRVASARTLQAAATLPDVPSFAGGLATRLLSESGRFDEARAFAASMAQSQNPQVRADFELRLKQIALEEVLTSVDEGAARFAAEHHRPPASVGELLEAGALSVEPIDPFGGEIVLTPAGARSTVQAERLKTFGLSD
jgi:hypothetical protein